MIEESAESPLEQHQVHLLLRPYRDKTPPRLALKPAMTAAGRGAMFFFSFLLAAGLVVGVVLIWRFGTAAEWEVSSPWQIAPNLLFTVMLGGLALGMVTLPIGASRRAAQREDARHYWDASLAQVRSQPATVISRRAGDAEGGGLAHIYLTVESAHGERYRGVWQPIDGRTGNVLQSQVPPLGAHAVLWRVPGADASTPHVIEVFDPTAILQDGLAETREYLG